MLATGFDLIEIKRIVNSMENPRFLTRVFSDEERNLFANRGWPAETVAANFAAKEAFSKALGTGIRGFALREVSVLRNAVGAPYFSLSGNAARLAADWELSLSLSHTDTLAAAFVVGIRKD